MIIARTDTDNNTSNDTTTVTVTNINSHLQDITSPDTVIEATKYVTKAGVAELVAQAKAYIDSL